MCDFKSFNKKKIIFDFLNFAFKYSNSVTNTQIFDNRSNIRLLGYLTQPHMTHDLIWIFSIVFITASPPDCHVFTFFQILCCPYLCFDSGFSGLDTATRIVDINSRFLFCSSISVPNLCIPSHRPKMSFFSFIRNSC